MNIARASSSGNVSNTAVTPPSSEEYVRQSRLTVCTSSAVVADQYPASAGYAVIRAGPVNRALPAQLRVQLVWRTVLPQVALADEHTLKIAANRRHVDLQIVVARCAIGYYWLASQAGR